MLSSSVALSRLVSLTSGMMNQATSRPPHRNLSGLRTVFSILCVIVRSEAVAGRPPQASGLASAELSTSMDGSMSSSSSFSRQLVQEDVGFFWMNSCQSLSASSGYVQLAEHWTCSARFALFALTLLTRDLGLWMITVLTALARSLVFPV